MKNEVKIENDFWDDINNNLIDAHNKKYIINYKY